MFKPSIETGLEGKALLDVIHFWADLVWGDLGQAGLRRSSFESQKRRVREVLEEASRSGTKLTMIAVHCDGIIEVTKSSYSGSVQWPYAEVCRKLAHDGRTMQGFVLAWRDKLNPFRFFLLHVLLNEERIIGALISNLPPEQ